MRFDEMLGAEMGRQPGLGQRFCEAGPNRTRKMLTVTIAVVVQQDEVRKNEPHLAAQDVIAFWLGMVTPRQRFNPTADVEGSDPGQGLPRRGRVQEHFLL
jgi:hypothetical protein